MKPHPWRLASLLCTLFMAAACAGPSDQQRAAWQLDHRLQARLSSDIAAGDAIVQTLPDGAQVTLLNHAALPNGVQTVGNSADDGRAQVIQGLLDPRLVRIQLADTSPLPPDQQQARVQDLAQYFTEFRLGPTLQPAAPPQAIPVGPSGAVPAGLTITISVHCPPDHGGFAGDIDMAPPIDTDIQPASCE